MRPNDISTGAKDILKLSKGGLRVLAGHGLLTARLAWEHAGLTGGSPDKNIKYAPHH